MTMRQTCKNVTKEEALCADPANNVPNGACVLFGCPVCRKRRSDG